MGDKEDSQVFFVLVIASSLMTAVLGLSVLIMLGAAFAFSNGSVIGTPVVAVFDGSRVLADSPTVTVTTSAIGIALSCALLALPLPLWFMAVRRRTASSSCVR